MNKPDISFDSLVETVYNLTLEERMTLKNLLEHNVADSRRNEIADNFKQTQKEEKAKGLQFSSDIKELKKML